MKHTAVFATFRDRPHTEAAVKALVEGGFPEEDIAVLLAENVGTSDFAHERHSKAPEGTAAGAGAGAIIGGALGLLAGLGTIVLPTVGQFLVASPVFDALAGAGAVGLLGGLAGAAIGLGIPEFEAKRYRGLIKDGRGLLSVHCQSSDTVRRAKEILKGLGGQGIVSTGESGAGFVLKRKPFAGYRTAHGSLR